MWMSLGFPAICSESVSPTRIVPSRMRATRLWWPAEFKRTKNQTALSIPLFLCVMNTAKTQQPLEVVAEWMRSHFLTKLKSHSNGSIRSAALVASTGRYSTFWGSKSLIYITHSCIPYLNTVLGIGACSVNTFQINEGTSRRVNQYFTSFPS